MQNVLGTRQALDLGLIKPFSKAKKVCLLGKHSVCHGPSHQSSYVVLASSKRLARLPELICLQEHRMFDCKQTCTAMKPFSQDVCGIACCDEGMIDGS